MIRMKNLSALALLATVLLSASAARAAQVGVNLPRGVDLPKPARVSASLAPAGVAVSTTLTVKAGFVAVPVYFANVASPDPVRRAKAMDDKINSSRYHDGAFYATFDMEGPVTVTVTSPVEIREAKVLPTSFGIKPQIEGRRVTFTLDRPRLVTLELNGDWVHSLQLFANPIETNIPDPKDPNVIYFGPGVHEIEGMTVGSGKTVYIAGGAFLRGKIRPGQRGGAFFNLVGDNITLRGRGILDASGCPTHSRNMIFVRGSNITLEGVILHDSPHWTVPIRRSDNVTIRNLKLLGSRANSDGIDICNSRNVEVTDCFIRTLDDLVVVKSDTGQGEVHDVNVTQCVLWNEVAHALSIGAELRENVSRVRFADCDVIHDKGREWTLRVYHCDAARISDVVFENIRVEETKKFISLWIGKAIWSRDKEGGRIDNVTFRDIRATGAQPRVELKGFDAGHLVEKANFENVVVNGRPLQAADVKQNEFVREVSVK